MKENIMKRFAWITDSSSGLSEEFIKQHHIFVLPLHVIINGISYKEDVEITKDDVYDRLKKHGEEAGTSQPIYCEFMELYEKLKNVYDCGIAIHASKELTGTYDSSVSAAKQTGFPVEVIDSKMGAYALGKMIKNGIELEENGSS